MAALIRTWLLSLALAGAALVFSGSPARAEPSVEPPPSTAGTKRTLTQDALVALARAQNPSLRAAQHDREVAAAGVTTASALENPSLRVEWLHAITPDRMGFGVGLGWSPPHPTVYAARKEEARARTREVEEELVERAWDLEATVRAGFVAAEAQGELLRVATQAVDARRALLAALRERAAHGVSTKVEVSLAALSVARAEHEREGLSLQRETTLAKLAGLAGLPPGTSLELAASTAPDEAIGELARLEQRALVERASLKADAARIDQRDQALRGERAKRLPWIGLASLPRYRYSDMSNITHDLAFAVDISLPVLDTNGGRIAAAEAMRAKESALHAAHVAEVLREVATARNEAIRQKVILDRYEAAVTPILAEHAALLREALAGHQVDTTAVLAAADVALRCERELAEGRLGVRRAQIALARASGGFQRGPTSGAPR